MELTKFPLDTRPYICIDTLKTLCAALHGFHILTIMENDQL
jgi:hypothetical protein